MSTTVTVGPIEVREIFVRAVAEHEHLELHETANAVWVERFPGLVYMAVLGSRDDDPNSPDDLPSLRDKSSHRRVVEKVPA